MYKLFPRLEVVAEFVLSLARMPVLQYLSHFLSLFIYQSVHSSNFTGNGCLFDGTMVLFHSYTFHVSFAFPF